MSLPGFIGCRTESASLRGMLVLDDRLAGIELVLKRGG